jgi:DNA end-binding protein Ku
MGRAQWSGSLSFGLVNVPVALFSAVRDLDLRFRQLHAPDTAPIEIRRFCSEEGREVPVEEIGRGHVRRDGEQVVLSDEELAAVAPRRTRTIEIEAFVDRRAIDPMYFDHPYFLAPDGGSEGTLRAYWLLVEVMGRTDQAAIGRFVLHTREHLVAIRARDRRLALTTMRFADEVRPTDEIDTGGRNPRRQEIEQAVALIEALSRDWDPTDYDDRFRARLEQIIARKQRGERVASPPPEPAPTPVPDLMAALERSVREAGRR